MLQDVGITCNIEVMEFGSFISRTSAGEHDMGYFGWVTSTTDADYTYYSLEHSSQQGAAGNRSFIADPEVDKLIETGRTSADESVRLKAYEDLAVKLKEVNNNAPITTAPSPRRRRQGGRFRDGSNRLPQAGSCKGCKIREVKGEMHHEIIKDYMANSGTVF